MWQPIVICGLCGHQHPCTRLVWETCSFVMVCHSCEALLTVVITTGELVLQQHAEGKPWQGPFRVIGTVEPLRSGS